MKPTEREVRVTVDLDAEQGRPARPDKPNVHRYIVRQTNEVGFQSLMGCLNHYCDLGTGFMEAINVLDHLLREASKLKLTSNQALLRWLRLLRGDQRAGPSAAETPKLKSTSIKRSYAGCLRLDTINVLDHCGEDTRLVTRPHGSSNAQPSRSISTS